MAVLIIAENRIMKAISRSIGALAWATALTACGGGGGDGGRAPDASAVIEWNRFASELVATNPLPPFQVRSMAVVQIAVHDAINAIEPRYDAYLFSAHAPGASFDAAVAAATHDTLVALMPDQAAKVDSQYQASLALVDDAHAREAGVAAGRAAAAAILAQRAGDDLFAAIGKPYTPGPRMPGVYQPTPPSNVVIGAGLGELAPFGIVDAGSFRSPAPHAISSAEYTADYEEVKAVGSAGSQVRSSEQTRIARFWFDAITREWHQAARQALTASSADPWQAARALALMSASMFDAVVVSFDTKYASNYWRPFSAIRQGDDDGNDATQGDATWEPLCVNPPFPEYNSTHAATAAAAAGVLSRLLGDRHVLTLDGPAPTAEKRSFGAFSEAAFEESVSRIYCGIHFRHAMDAGLAQGDQVAAQVINRRMLPNVVRDAVRANRPDGETVR